MMRVFYGGVPRTLRAWPSGVERDHPSCVAVSWPAIRIARRARRRALLRRRPTRTRYYNLPGLAAPLKTRRRAGRREPRTP